MSDEINGLFTPPRPLAPSSPSASRALPPSSVERQRAITSGALWAWAGTNGSFFPQSNARRNGAVPERIS
jgi:hypothetical protein